MVGRGVNQCHLGWKRDNCRHFAKRFCENGVVAKTSPGNVSDLVFL